MIKLNKIFKTALLSFLIISSGTSLVWAQSEKEVKIKGIIKDKNEDIIPYAQIFTSKDKYLGHSEDDGTFEFTIDKEEQFIIRLTGFQADTIAANTWKNGDIIYLQSGQVLDEVQIIGKEKGSEFDQMSMVQRTQISSKELLKAACCDLSESFETTPSVDVGFSDGVSGYKTIQLLGLSGPSTLYTRESIADLRGLGSTIGLTFTPGAWVESMQLSKGAGSVKNGFEGIAGQINVELPKPFISEEPRIFLNAYQNTHGRSELNAIWNKEVSPSLSTNILAHYSNTWLETDANNDGFRDNPLGQKAILANRWLYFGKSGWEFQAGAKGVYMDLEGGSMQKNEANPEIWRYGNDIKRLETWAKIGKIYEETPWKSMGLQLSYTLHDQESQWHNNIYKGLQNSFAANYLYSSIISNTMHKITVGAQFISDNYKETWQNNAFPEIHHMYLGAYGEYNYNPTEKFNLQVGLRSDYDFWRENIFITPRIHIRTELWKDGIARISAGRAKRNIHPFAEFAPFLASNRSVVMHNNSELTNDLPIEDAWNGGLSLTQSFTLAQREGQIAIDAYYTHYNRQIIADYQNPGVLEIYETDPGSQVWSSQIEASYEPINRLELRASYRYQHINIPYKNGKQLAFLHAPHKAFFNAGYSTRNAWSFDATLHFLGKQKVPYHPGLPSDILANKEAPEQLFINAQISKSWKNNKYDWYIGVENITNQMQKSVILNNQNLNDPLLDASLIYGSPMGRLIYTGFRIRI